MQHTLASSLPGIFFVAAVFAVPACSPVDVNETSFACESDDDCASGFVCDSAGTPPRCVRTGTTDILDDGSSPDGNADAEDVVEADSTPDQNNDTEDTQDLGDTGDTQDAEPDLVVRNACQSDLDQQSHMNSDVEAITIECTADCFSDTECLSACIREQTMLSDGCVDCYGEHVTCAAQECLSACIGGASAECNDCRVQSGCVARLDACRGPVPAPSCTEGAQCGGNCGSDISAELCACRVGTTQCAGGSEVCIDENGDQVIVPFSQQETCGNNIDDDCDGDIDEGCMSCDPLTQNCPDGEACIFGQDQGGNVIAVCSPSGSASSGEACDQSNLCVAGTLCVGEGMNNLCLPICSIDGTDPKCANNVNCLSIGLEGTEYENVGVCEQP